MNKRLQRLGIVLVICFLAITVKLHYTQLVEVDALGKEPTNNRETQRRLNRPRGMIISADGVVLAKSESEGGPMVPQKRTYPEGDTFGHVTGVYSGLFPTELGVEKFYDRQLIGDTTAQQFDGLTNLFAEKSNVGNVTLTVRKDLQQLAKDQLGERLGAVTVMDPRSGAILAMWSFPSYDPNPLTLPVGRKVDEALKIKTLYDQNPAKPMLSKNYRDRYFPGSSFKPVTAAVGIGTGKVDLGRPVYPTMQDYKAPDAPNVFNNFGKKPCGGPLSLIMASSCNTAFMVMGVENGWPAMGAGATAFGYNQDVPIDLPSPVQSTFPDTPEEFRLEAIAGLAQNSIGQKSNEATPLQIAMISAAAANGGVVMKPHVMADVRNNQDASIVETYPKAPWTTAMSPETAEVLKQAMFGPVNDPNGSAYGRIRMSAGYTAWGKTGTAQVGAEDNRTLNTWFTGFAGPTGGTPTVVVSVVVLGQRVGDEVTGGQVSAPIANAMLNAALPVVDAVVDPTSVIVTPSPTAPGAGPFGTTTRPG